jgi:hypothetical protein
LHRWPRFKGWTSAGQCVLCLFLAKILFDGSLAGPKGESRIA